METVDCFLEVAQSLDLALFTLIYWRPNLFILKVCFISIWGCQLRFLLSLWRKILSSAPLCWVISSALLVPYLMMVWTTSASSALKPSHVCPGKKYNYFYLNYICSCCVIIQKGKLYSDVTYVLFLKLGANITNSQRSKAWGKLTFLFTFLKHETIKQH